MRSLIIGALLATLIGCCRTPPQASLERCTSKGCIHRTAANPRVELKPVSFRPGPATANVKFTTTAKAPEPASADHTGLIEKSANSAINSTPEAPPPDRLAETSDTVLKNAKTTIASKMENPASVEFKEIKRAERKNAVGRSIELHLRLRQGENRVRRRDRRQAVFISCPRRRGIHRRLLHSYVPPPQYLQLRSRSRTPAMSAIGT